MVHRDPSRMVLVELWTFTHGLNIQALKVLLLKMILLRLEEADLALVAIKGLQVALQQNKCLCRILHRC
jgi:hypothetical protein